MQAIDELKQVLPIPQLPIDTDPAQLQAEALGLRTGFPSDFVQYSLIYGSGRIHFGNYDFEVISAFRPQYPQFAKEFLEIFSELRQATDGFESGLTLFPEEGGLLPFAIDSEGTYHCWETKGSPDEWRVVWIFSFGEGDYERFDLGLAEFLARFLTRQVVATRIHYESPWDLFTDVAFEPKVYQC